MPPTVSVIMIADAPAACVADWGSGMRREGGAARGLLGDIVGAEFIRKAGASIAIPAPS
jgi:hypothetical protein